MKLPGVRADLSCISLCLLGVVVRLLGLVLGLLGLLVGLVSPLLRALSTLVGLLGLVLRLLGLVLGLQQLVLRLLDLALGLLGLVLGLPRLVLRLLGSASGLLRPLSCVVGIMLCHASLVFHSLQVPLQLVDRQVKESALVLVALALLSSLIPLGGGLLSWCRRCHADSLMHRLTTDIKSGRVTAFVTDRGFGPNERFLVSRYIRRRSKTESASSSSTSEYKLRATLDIGSTPTRGIFL